MRIHQLGILSQCKKSIVYNASETDRPPWTFDNCALTIFVGWLTGGTGL